MEYSNYDKRNTLKGFIEGDNLDVSDYSFIERLFYEEVLERVLNNPRFYLDNLEELDVFRCSYMHYVAEKDLNLGYLHSEEKDL